MMCQGVSLKTLLGFTRTEMSVMSTFLWQNGSKRSSWTSKTTICSTSTNRSAELQVCKKQGSSRMQSYSSSCSRKTCKYLLTLTKTWVWVRRLNSTGLAQSLKKEHRLLLQESFRLLTGGIQRGLSQAIGPSLLMRSWCRWQRSSWLKSTIS